MRYTWNNLELKKKSSIYNWAAVISMLLALGFFLALPNYMPSLSATTLNYLVLAFMGLGFILFIMAWRSQNQDRKLKKNDKKDS